MTHSSGTHESRTDSPPTIQGIIEAVKNEFGDDRKRIDHALSVFRYAQELLEKESGDKDVVYAAALLHDIGIHDAERKYGSAAGHYQEIEGPPIAKKIMANLGIDRSVIDRVCTIIGNHHSVRGIDTPEFRIIWDADWLVNIPDEFPGLEKEKLQNTIERLFRTETGKKKAYRLYY
ncbi:MAG: HD domain-containing protein [Candidatus Latescibacter sp.]|nr:HD domain-containing protein [Candidatus Latescibacter sp.]